MKVPEKFVEYAIMMFQKEWNSDVIHWDNFGLSERRGNTEDLKVDGIWGPKTQSAWDSVSKKPLAIDFKEAWAMALSHVGLGGNGKVNNEGPWLDEIRLATGMPKAGNGAWCAVGISYAILLSGSNYFEQAKSRGARELCNNVLRLPGAVELTDAADIAPGEVAIGLYATGGTSSGRHVRLVGRNDDGGAWKYIGYNETSADVARYRDNLTEAEIERRLIKLVTIR